MQFYKSISIKMLKTTPKTKNMHYKIFTLQTVYKHIKPNSQRKQHKKQWIYYDNYIYAKCPSLCQDITFFNVQKPNFGLCLSNSNTSYDTWNHAKSF